MCVACPPNYKRNKKSVVANEKNIFDSAVQAFAVPEIKMIIIYLIPINRNINQC